MATPGDPNAIQVNVVLDPQSAGIIAEAISTAIVSGFNDAFKEFGKTFAKNVNFDRAFDSMGKSFKKAINVDMLKDLTKGFEGIKAELRDMIVAFNKAGVEVTTLNQTIRSTGSIRRQEAIAVRTTEQQQLKLLQIESEGFYKSQVVQAQGAAQAKIVADKAAAAERLQIQRAALDAEGRAQREASELSVVSAKLGAKQRLAITRGMVDGILALERGLGTAVAGIARTATSAVSRAFSGLNSSLRAIFRRSNQEMTEGLSGSLNKRESLIRNSFLQQERIISNSVTRQERQLTELRTIASTGVAGAVTGRGIGFGIGGVAGGIGIGALLSSGFERFSNIERLNKQFQALTGSAEQTAVLMQQIADFAKKTPFDLIGVADLAKGILAMGTAVDDVMPRIEILTDAVAFTGGGTDQLNRVQRAIGQVISAGRLQGDELNQLAENLPGLNIRQILADQLTGGDVAALVELQEAGDLSADAFVTGLLNGLGGDTRIQGAAKDLADTLAGRAANLRESFADLGAAIIGTVAGPLKKAIVLTQSALQGLADFVKGDVSEGLLILRDGLQGVAIAMGAIIAAKAAVEVFKLLGLALQFALTPMGALIVSAALIGAAFSILFKRSEAFRNMVEQVVGVLKEVGERIVDFVVPYLERFADFVTATLIPAIADLAFFLVDKLVVGLEKLAQVVVRVALPILERLGVFLREEVVPFIQPMIDGFRKLGDAIGDAFTGDFSTLISGLGAAAGGVGQVAGRIGRNILTALEPVKDAVVEFFKDLFSVGTLQTAFNAILDFAEFLGRTIGNIVTDPAFIKGVAIAAAGIVAAAALIAANFIKGFGEELIKNLPGLARLIKNAIIDALQLALDNPEIVIIAFAGLFAYRRLSALVSSVFQRVGQDGAVAFGKGFASQARGFFQGFTRGPTSLLGGAGLSALNAADQRGLAAANQLRILGQPSQRIGLDEASIANAEAKVRKLRDALTDAQLRGLEFRDRLTSAFNSVKIAAGGLGPAIFAGFTGGFKGLRTSLANTLDQLRTEAAKQGQTLGGFIGRGMAKGAAAALGGFFTGKAAGEAGVNPLAAGLTTGVTAGVLFGPAVGVVAGAAASFGAVLGDMDRAAGQARERIEGLATAISTNLSDALASGEIDVINFNNALAGGDLRQQLFDTLGGPVIVGRLEQLGISLGTIERAWSGDAVAAKTLNDRLADQEVLSAIVKRTHDELGTAIEHANLKARAFNTTISDNLDLQHRAGERGDILSTAPDVTPTIVAVDTISRELLDLQATVDTTAEKIRDLFTPDEAEGFGAVVDQAIINVSNLGTQIQEAFSAGGVVGDAQKRELERSLGDTISSVVQQGISDGVIIDENTARFATAGILQAALANVTDQSLIDAITATYEAGIAGVVPLIDTTQATQNAIAIGTAIDAYFAEHPVGENMVDGSGAAAAAAQEMAQYFVENPISADIEPNTPEAEAAAREILRAIKEEFGLSDEQMNAIGRQISAGLANGMDSGRLAAVAKAKQIASEIKTVVMTTLKIASPSRVMFDIGQDITQGLIDGIDSELTDVTSLITDAFDDMIEQVRRRAGSASGTIQGVVGQLFGATIGSGSIGPGGGAVNAVPSAISKFTSALSGIGSTFDSNVNSVFDAAIAASEGKVLSASQRDFLGESVFTLDPTQLTGSANREALTSALDAIADIGQAMLASGSSPAQTAQALSGYVDQVQWAAGQLGIFGNEVDALIDQFGLSDAALASFTTAAADAAAATQAASDAVKANEARAMFEELAEKARNDRNNDGIPDSDQDFTLRNLPQRPVILNIYPQYGDPEAIGLAAVNAIVADSVMGQWVG